MKITVEKTLPIEHRQIFIPNLFAKKVERERERYCFFEYTHTTTGKSRNWWLISRDGVRGHWVVSSTTQTSHKCCLSASTREWFNERNSFPSYAFFPNQAQDKWRGKHLFWISFLFRVNNNGLNNIATIAALLLLFPRSSTLRHSYFPFMIRR